jgi:hypothetical protein
MAPTRRLAPKGLEAVAQDRNASGLDAPRGRGSGARLRAFGAST